ncbi:MAG: LytTR family transcriptional regulator DNA-binding domain-containing protein [Polaribacter sp.]|uniref:LytTR family transcriptional regulator DNA-binding domain-containing protein n=1 Tax=Polaribacter sp. TaxID=1920175 RepID=UPI002F35790E
MKTISNWLSMPYYFNPNISFKLKMSFFHGLFIFLFLYIFRPFYLSQFDVIILEYTLGIGIIAFLGTFIVLYIPALIFKNYFNEDNWTVGRNIFLMTVGITFVGVFLWYLGETYKEPYNLRKLSLFEFLLYTFLVSLIPLTLFIFINEKNVREKRKKRAEKINTHNKLKQQQNKNTLKDTIIIYSENKKEFIEFNIKNLVYITSQGNYASFFLLKDDNDLTEKILRVTLTKINKELEEYSCIIRCHKSYIINSKFINDINGNARGYLLKSNYISFKIPVSRSFSKQSLIGLLN